MITVRDQAEMKGRLGSGRSAVVLADAGERALKLFHERVAARQVQHEFDAQRLAQEAGLPCPAVFGIIEREGRPGILMAKASGMPLLRFYRWRPWALLGALASLGKLHACMHAVPGGALRSQKAFIARHIRAARLNGDHEAMCLQVLDTLPDGDRLCHGDLHPGNVIWSEDGPQIIDWGTACRGAPAADAARTLLLLGLAPLPSGMGYLGIFRKLAQRAYLAGYLSGEGASRTGIAEWWLPVAAARLAGGNPHERPRLRAAIERACAARSRSA